MRRWLGRLGDPQQALRCTVVAGSKGKGSTAAMLEAMLRAAGRRTGLYTQPHLHRYAERIRIAGRPLPPAASRAGLRAVLHAAPGPVTAFEAATVYGLWAFARAGVAEAVLEVGFGGRLDAVAEAEPSLVLFAPLEAEHADLFGPGLPAVLAYELGLCRYGRTCLAAPQPPAARAAFLARLASQGAAGGLVPEPGSVGGKVRLTLPDGTRLEAKLALAGPFQRGNAALAAAGAAALGVPAAAMRQGLERVRWPGRWERVAHRPAVIVDGAHTPASAAAVAAALDAEGGTPLALVVGMLADKDALGFASALRGRPGRVFATAPDHPRALPAPEVAAAFRAAGWEAVTCVPGLPAALAAARAWAGGGGLCVVTGSLRLAAETRELLGLSRAGARGPRAAAPA